MGVSVILGTIGCNLAYSTSLFVSSRSQRAFINRESPAKPESASFIKLCPLYRSCIYAFMVPSGIPRCSFIGYCCGHSADRLSKLFKCNRLRTRLSVCCARPHLLSHLNPFLNRLTYSTRLLDPFFTNMAHYSIEKSPLIPEAPSFCEAAGMTNESFVLLTHSRRRCLCCSSIS